MKAGGFLIGTPADIIEQLEAVEKRYPGLDGQLDGQIPRRPVAVDYARAGARGHHHPVFPQLAGKFGFRDEFAQDCLLHQRER